MLKYLKLRDMPELKNTAADWFHSKWNVPKKSHQCISLPIMLGFMNAMAGSSFAWSNVTANPSCHVCTFIDKFQLTEENDRVTYDDGQKNYYYR